MVQLLDCEGIVYRSSVRPSPQKILEKSTQRLRRGVSFRVPSERTKAYIRNTRTAMMAYVTARCWYILVATIKHQRVLLSSQRAKPTCTPSS